LAFLDKKGEVDIKVFAGCRAIKGEKQKRGVTVRGRLVI